MLSIFKTYCERLKTLHTGVEQAIADLPQEALDWQPGPGMNSLCVLVVHLLGAERYWIGDVVAGESSNRNRPAEFEAKGLGEAALRQRLRDTLAYSRHVIEGLTVEELDEPRVAPMGGQTVTVAWALLHALEHTGVHLGHIQVTRQLWEQARRTSSVEH